MSSTWIVLERDTLRMTCYDMVLHAHHFSPQASFHCFSLLSDKVALYCKMKEVDQGPHRT